MDRRQARKELSTDEGKPRIPPQERRESDEVEEALGSGNAGKPRLSGGTTPIAEVDRSGDTAMEEQASSEPRGGGEGEHHATGPSEPEGEEDQEQEIQPRPVFIIQGGDFTGGTIGGQSTTHIHQEFHHYHPAQPSVLHMGVHQNVSGMATLSPAGEIASSGMSGLLSGTLLGIPPATEDPATGANQNLHSTKIVRDQNGMVTTLKNLLGGTMSVSKKIEAVITSAEVKFQLGEVYVTFPQESFERATQVILMAEIDSSKLQEKFIGHTPTLYVHAPGLRKDLDIRLPTWSYALEGREATSRLWHHSRGSNTWEPTEFSMPFTGNPYFDLKWRDFCSIVMGSEPPSGHQGIEIPNTGKRVASAVYTSDERNLTVAFHLDDRGSGSNSSAAEWVAERIAKLAPPRSLRLALRTLRVATGKTVTVKISCDPSTLGPAGGIDTFQIVVDQDFTQDGYDIRNTTVTGNVKRSQNIDVMCKLFKSGYLITADSFSYTWKPRIGSSATRRRARAAASRNPPVAAAPQPHIFTVYDTLRDEGSQRRRGRVSSEDNDTTDETEVESSDYH